MGGSSAEVKRPEDVSGEIWVASGDHRVLHDGSWGLLEGLLGIQGGSTVISKRYFEQLGAPKKLQRRRQELPRRRRSTQKDAKRAPQSSQEHLEMEDVELAYMLIFQSE